MQTSNHKPSEIKQIEEWTQMKIGSIVFDSDIDNWKQQHSEFGQKIINKSNLIFIIEDGDGNLFGGYVSSKITKNNWVTDLKSFVFSLKSNGRLDGMLKFELINPQFSFLAVDTSYDYLFLFGQADICVYKENNKNNTYCYQYTYDYKDVQHSFCGKTTFIPTRITVIQMI